MVLSFFKSVFLTFLIVSKAIANTDPIHSSREVRRTVLEITNRTSGGYKFDDLLVQDSIFVNGSIAEVAHYRLLIKRNGDSDSIPVGERKYFDGEGRLFLVENYELGEIISISSEYPCQNNLIFNGSFEQISNTGEDKRIPLRTTLKLLGDSVSRKREIELVGLLVKGADTIRYEKVIDSFYYKSDDCDEELKVESYFVYKNSALTDSITSRMIISRGLGLCKTPLIVCNRNNFGSTALGWYGVGGLRPRIFNSEEKTPNHPLDGFISEHQLFEIICGKNFAELSTNGWRLCPCSYNPVMLTRLASTLDKGSGYSMSFWIWKPSTYPDNYNFSIGLWKNEPTFKELHSKTKNLIEIKDFNNGITGKWYKVSIDFVAADYARFLSIGFHNKLPDYRRLPSDNPVGCYVDGLVLVCNDVDEQQIVTLFEPREAPVKHLEPNNQQTSNNEFEKRIIEASISDTLPILDFRRQHLFGLIHFEHNSFELQNNSSILLDSLAIVMSQNEDCHIILIGHTDSTGTNSYNMDLSLKRAQEAESYLVSLGVDGRRIEVFAKGCSNPVETNITPEANALNRRVEILIFFDE